MTRQPDDCDGGDDPDRDRLGCACCGHVHADVAPDPATGVHLCGPCWWACFVVRRHPDVLRARRRPA